MAGAIAGLGMLFMAESAMATCPGCLPPRPPVSPPVPPGGGCHNCGPVTPPVACCGGGNVNVNVNINNVSAGASANANASANAAARAYGSGRGSGIVVVGGGGGAYFNVDQPYPMTAGLSVEAMAAETVRVPYSASRRMEKRVRIQAVCLDDRNVPHPASQVRPGKDVAYEGEIFRCIVGTKMQYTISDLDGGPGETLLCNKREALWYGGNRLECRPEKQERDCNERSLLRRYGAGVKELLLVREETYTEYREEVVERSVVTAGSMMMDGGVGGRVF